jgi:hypothetical protein
MGAASVVLVLEFSHLFSGHVLPAVFDSLSAQCRSSATLNRTLLYIEANRALDQNPSPILYPSPRA